MWSSSLRSFAFSSRSARSKGNPGYRRESWRDKRNESLFVRSGFSNVSCTFTSDSSIEYRRLSFSIALSRSCLSTRPNRSSAVKLTKTSHTSLHTIHDGLQGSLRVAATFCFTPNPLIHIQNIEQKILFCDLLQPTCCTMLSICHTSDPPIYTIFCRRFSSARRCQTTSTWIRILRKFKINKQNIPPGFNHGHEFL